MSAPGPRVGWIGLGRMGAAMAGHVAASGAELTVSSRSPERRALLVERGAAEAAGPAACAREADVLFVSLSDDRSLREVLLGPEGVIAAMRSGAVLAETSTVSVEVSAEVAAAATAAGVDYLRMPISGNAASAERGEVTALVSGPAAAWERARPFVESFSKGQVYLGGGEEARVMKLVVNAILVITGQAMAEALTLGRRAGLDWQLLLDTLSASTIASPWLKAKVEQLRRGDLEPTMTTTLITKDMDLVLAAGRDGGVPMPLTALTRELLRALAGEGFAESDFIASVELTGRQAGLPSIAAGAGA